MELRLEDEEALSLTLGTMTNDEIVKQLAVELSWKTSDPMECVLQPTSVFQLVAALQLARRHPHFTDQETVAAAAERFIAAAREYFSNCPTVLEVIRQGDDPSFDVTGAADDRR